MRPRGARTQPSTARLLAAEGPLVRERLAMGIPLSDPGPLQLERPAASVDDPMALYGVAITLVARFEPADALPWIERLERLTAEDHWLWPRIQFLWALYHSEMGDPGPVVEHGHRALTAFEPDRAERPVPASVGDTHPWIATIDGLVPVVLKSVISRAYALLGNYRAGHEALVGIGHRSEVVEGWAVQVSLAMLFCCEGRLTEAATAARRALAGTGRAHDRAPAAVLGAHQALLAVLCERDELDEAEGHLDEERMIVDLRPGNTRWEATVDLDEIGLRRAQGDHERADRLLTRVTRVDRQDGLPEHLRRRLLRATVLRSIDRGGFDAADALLRAGPEPRSALLQARVDLAAERPDRAAARLRGAVPPVSSGWAAIERLVLLALAELACGDGRSAVACLARAVETGRADRYVRTFVDLSPGVAPLLVKLRGPYPDTYVEHLLSHMDQPGARREEVSTRLPEAPLTPRELEILQRLTTHLTQQEIAADLYVSVNTLKTHLKSLYRKLGVARRSEAVDEAASMGLLALPTDRSGRVELADPLTLIG